jgi:hypothetical protein
MRGRMFVSGVLLAALATIASGCGGNEAPCFQGPSVTYSARIEDWIDRSLGIEGMDACLVVEGAPCGCRTTNAEGWVELRLPASAEVGVRFSSELYRPAIYFYATPAGGYLGAQYRLIPRPVADALAATYGFDVDWYAAVVVVEAHPIAGASLEGSTVELLDASGAPLVDGIGPFYSDPIRNVPDPEASASLGSHLFAIWGNLPPGPVLVRATSSAGEPLFAGCGHTESGWVRDLNGEPVVAMDTFPGAMSVAIARECTP